jgi:hypothetical protein
MKKFFSRFLILGMLLLPIGVLTLVPLSNVGCTTVAQSNAVTVEYQTLSGVVNLVDSARGMYDTLYKAGKISVDTDVKVAAGYLEYQRVGNLAISAARAQAVAVAAGTDPKTLVNNPYIADLQTLVNGLVAIFSTTTPPATTVTSVRIVKNAKVGGLTSSHNNNNPLNNPLHSTKK